MMNKRSSKYFLFWLLRLPFSLSGLANEITRPCFCRLFFYRFLVSFCVSPHESLVRSIISGITEVTNLLKISQVARWHKVAQNRTKLYFEVLEANINLFCLINIVISFMKKRFWKDCIWPFTNLKLLIKFCLIWTQKVISLKLWQRIWFLNG